MSKAGSPQQSQPIRERAESLVRAHAKRTTGSRVSILACLLAANRALSHNDIEECLKDDKQIDRTTVYRILEWLTEKRLAHKIVGTDGIWRFNAATEEETHAHPHFQCRKCEKLVCLADARFSVALPLGYKAENINLTITGVCAECS